VYTKSFFLVILKNIIQTTKPQNNHGQLSIKTNIVGKRLLVISIVMNHNIKYDCQLGDVGSLVIEWFSKTTNTSKEL
jgi:hypothetical protein